MKLYEHIGFTRSYEDYKNNLYIIELTDEIKDWIKKYIKGEYDIDCEEIYNDNIDHHNNIDYIHINFKDQGDEEFFYLRWKEHYQYFPNMFTVQLDYDKIKHKNEIIKWLNEYIGPEHFMWKIYKYQHLYKFYDGESAALFKLTWA